ncbi:hypothetical protein C8D88_105137 [Lentzea atacamensis]|uniref:Uncharacterized protein n=1 Tax=Lentzea atacamensis TaxID=531938 RepID=A0A316I087_9PSEU|nr:hypothetical protein [Lentzea atacamensis]PWK86097.1 hypothetical protein C8D88_105137 [Lentzea atacamensis]
MPATIYIGDESRSIQRSTLGWVLGVLAERVSDEADAAALKEAADWGGWQMAVIDGNNYRDPVAIAQVIVTDLRAAALADSEGNAEYRDYLLPLVDDLADLAARYPGVTA